MALSRRTGRSRFTLILLVLTSATVVTLDFRGAGVVEDIRGFASTVFSPVRDTASSVFSPFSNAWNGVFDYGDLEDENERLREQLAEAQGDVVRADDLQRQMDEIAALNNLQLTSDIPSAIGRVVSGPLTNFEHSVEVDRGSDDGVVLGMPVITGAGLVGRVVQVTGGRSVVQLITDPQFDIGVRLVISGEVGIAHGTGDGRPLVVDAGIDPTVEIAEGESVTTSGVLRSIFPPDIPLGHVVRVTMSADLLTQELTIEPIADLANLSYVRILLWEPPA